MLNIKKVNSFEINHLNNIERNLKKTIRRIINDGGLKKKNDTGKIVLLTILSPRDKYVLSLLLHHNDLLIKIISLEAKEIRVMIKYTKKHYPDIYNKNTVLYKCIYNIFVTHGYEDSNNLDKYQFIKNIGLETCPYCNRNYIYTIAKNKKIKAEIDHFYPKDLYPILALSYFNLIPSCSTCNGLGAKSNQDTYTLKLRNPYLIKPSDFKFDFDIKSLNILNPISNIDKESIDIIFEKEIQNHSKVFGLTELYSEHRDIVIELYIKAKHHYVREYIDYLRSYDGILFSDDEIYRLITCGYKNEIDFHKRPLSKLIKDISEELDFL
jgi:hypothetical protein